MRRSPSASRAVGPSTCSSSPSIGEGVSLFDTLRDCLRRQQPVALATVIAGRGLGAKLLVRPGQEPEGGLGHPALDRVAARDALAELEAGRTGVRHYGAEGQANPETQPGVEVVSVFCESFAPPPRMLIFG